MSYTYLQAQGEESSAASFADIPPSVLSRLTSSAGAHCSTGNGMESSLISQSGTMSEPLTENLGHRELILSRRDSRATTSLRRAKRLELMGRSLPSSLKFAGSSLRFDPVTSSWKIAETLWEEDLLESSVSLPAWGMIQDGAVSVPVTSEPTTKGFGHGLFPTPMAGNEKWNGTFQEGGGSLNKWRETWLGRQWINPGFWEEIMGLPIGWTDSHPLDSCKFQQWLHSHGKY